MKSISILTSLLFALLAIGCTTSGPAKADEHAHEAEPSENEVHMQQRQLDVMSIELGGYQQLNLSQTVKASGELELPPQNKASLSAVLGGRVRSIEILAGEPVSKGQTLAWLENPDFIDMQQDYMAVVSQLAYLKPEFLRSQSLFRDSLLSEREFQEAQANYLSVVAEATGLETKLSMLGMDPKQAGQGNFLQAIPVKSPIDGFVRLVEINMGMFVQPEQEMFEIVDNKHIHIDLLVYEQDMNRIKVGQKVTFTLSNSPDSVFQGSVFSLGKAFEHEPKAMVVHAEIDNKRGNLLPGMYVDARILTSDHSVAALPNDAIVSDGGLSYVFALQPASANKPAANEKVFSRIEVSTGASDMGFTEVVTAYNLPDNLQFVTKGAFYLLAEMKKGQGGHGHDHGNGGHSH